MSVLWRGIEKRKGIKKEMKRWETAWDKANEYYDQAIGTNDNGKAIKLFDAAMALYLQVAKQAKTKEAWLISMGNARSAEAHISDLFAAKLVAKAEASSGREQAGYFREAASSLYSAYSSHKDAAENAKELYNLALHHNDLALYHNRISAAYEDHALYHYYLAWASKAVDNWDDALSSYKESLSLFESALEHYNKSLRIVLNPNIENKRRKCLRHIERCRYSIQEAESKTIGVKTDGTSNIHITGDFLGEGAVKQVSGGDIISGTKITGDSGMVKVTDRGSVGRGSTEKQFTKCPYCGETLNLQKTPKFCPFCGEQLK